MASSNRDQMNPTNLYDRRFLNQPEAYRGALSIGSLKDTVVGVHASLHPLALLSETVLQREQEASRYLFLSERGAPISGGLSHGTNFLKCALTPPGNGTGFDAAKRFPTAVSARGTTIGRLHCSIACSHSWSEWILRGAAVTSRTRCGAMHPAVEPMRFTAPRFAFYALR
jgi:hypothetical protein